MASTTPSGFWRCSHCNTPNPSAPYLTKCLGCGRPIPPFPTPEFPPAGQAESKPSERRGRGRKTLILAVGYAGVLLSSIGMIRGLELGWWLVATLLFMPRGLFLIPLIPLGVAAIRSRRSLVVAVVLLDLLLVVGPLMGFNVPVGRWFGTVPAGSKVRVMSFNQGDLRIDVPRLLRYLERHRVDVICFQERARGPGIEEELSAAGWHYDAAQKVASRFPIVKDLGLATSPFRSGSRFAVTLHRVQFRHPDGFDFVVGSVHLPTVRPAFGQLLRRNSEGFRLDLEWWREQSVTLEELMADSGTTPLIVAGDFNMPADSRRMATLRDRYPSAFEAAGWGWGFTRPTRFPWVRIDHVVASRDWSFTSCWVGPDLGSDHLPLIAEAVRIDREPGD